MRVTTFISFCIFILGCTSTRKAGPGSNNLNGTWLPVRQEIGGTSLPATAFEKQKLVIRDTAYTFIAESTDKGIIRYSNDKMDIYGKEGVNAGKHFTAIYKFVADSSGKGEQLAICYNLKGDSYPGTFDTKGKPTFFLSVFKKE